LDVPLDMQRHAGEVQRFLDKDLRNQAADEHALDRLLTGTRGEAIRALDRMCVARCERDASATAQAQLLCRSIREFAGRFRDAPILAYAPRPGLGVGPSVRKALAGLGVEYIDTPLNTTCHEYAPANRVFAGADADAGVRAVDSKGSASGGPGDRFDAYWAALAQRAGISLDRLPYLRSTIG